MNKEASIVQVLNDSNIPVLGKVIEDSYENFYVYVPISRDSTQKQVPSNRVLNIAIEALSSQDIKINFLLTDAHFQDIESGLRATLLHSFGKIARNVFTSISKKDVDVWIDSKVSEIIKADRDNMEVKVKKFLEGFNLNLRSLSSLNDINLPSKMAILKTIRLKSPASKDEIINELRCKGFEIPSDDWMNRKLDLFRKSKNILRLKNGKYALTYVSISALGSSIGRASPDIERFLALARAG